MLIHETGAMLHGAGTRPERPLHHGQMEAGRSALAGHLALAAGAVGLLALAAVADLVVPEPDRPATASLTVFEPAGQYHVRLDPGGGYLVQVRGLRPRMAVQADGAADG